MKSSETTRKQNGFALVKTNLFYSFISALLIVFLFGCKKTEDFTPVAVNASLAVTASDSSFQLNESAQNNTALIFNWTTGTNNKTGASISYVLELDKKGNNFSTSLKNNIGKNIYSVNYSTLTLNTLLSTYWNAKADTTFALEARVYTIMGDGSMQGDTSASVTIYITPYNPVSKSLYIIGDATPTGWSADNADSLTPDVSVPGVFHYIGSLTPGNFKFITMHGSFIPSYNKGADSAHLFYRTSYDQPDDQFVITTPSVYNIDVNLITLTITVSKASAPLYSALWIVGDATPNGWNIDNPNQMKVDVFNPYVFHYNELLNAGEFKMPTGTGNWDGDFYKPLVNHPLLSDSAVALFLGNANPPDNKWQITTAGAYKISLNILYNSIHITPFTPYSSLWMVGDATPNGWNIDAPSPMIAIAGDPYTFVYEGPLFVGEFKIPITTGNWDTDFFRPDMNHPAITDTNAPLVAYASNAADNNDYKWQITTAGNYKVTLNQLYETISIVKE